MMKNKMVTFRIEKSEVDKLDEILKLTVGVKTRGELIREVLRNFVKKKGFSTSTTVVL